MGQCYRFVGWEFLGLGLEQFPLELRTRRRRRRTAALLSRGLEAKTWWSMTLLRRGGRCCAVEDVAVLLSNIRLFGGSLRTSMGTTTYKILRYNYCVSLLPLADQNLWIHMTYCSHKSLGLSMIYFRIFRTAISFPSTTHKSLWSDWNEQFYALPKNNFICPFLHP